MSTPTTDATLAPLPRATPSGLAGWSVTRWNLARVRDTLRSRTVWLCGVLAFIVFALAFQIPYVYTIDFGARPDHLLILGGMHDDESDGAQTYRWTRARAELRVPALVSGAWQLVMRVNGWQPAGGVPVQIQLGDAVLTRPSDGDWQEWTFDLDVSAGDYDIILSSDTFKPSDSGNADTRELGIRLDSMSLAPMGGSFRIPPVAGYILPLTLGVMLFYATARLAEMRERYLLALTAALIAALFAAIAFYRVYLNAQAVWTLVFFLVGGLVFMLFGMDLLGGLYRRLGLETDRISLNRLGLIVVAFFVLKAVGSFYPGMYIIDQIFHLHRLQFVEKGNLFFVTRSREFGSLETVYPPALYVFLSPLATLFGDDLALIRLAVILTEAIGGLMLFAVARLAHLSSRAGFFAVLLYLGSPIAFITFGWGVYANLFAQQLFILMLVLWFTTRWRGHPLQTAAFIWLALIVGLVSHASMVILLSLYWGLVSCANWLLFQEHKRAAFVFGALVAALLVTFGVYFSFFVDKTLANIGALQSNSASAATEGFERVVGNGMAEVGIGLLPVRVHSPVEWVLQGAWYLARETWVYYRTIPILFALVGFALMWCDPVLKDLAVVLFVGVLLVITFFLVGMMLNVYTRYMLFGAPFFALGGAYVLDRLAARGLPGRAVAVGTLALVIVSGIGYWFTRVVN
ncbi:MAG: hypothetical protein IT331_01160 [Anaerolineae bacterium]|nr:hypothetical protein [Anaerolineae bacterium]